MSVLIYVHGTNGSGKSTLARAVMAAAGGHNGYEEHATKPDKCGCTYTNEGTVLLGKYDTACGGVDGVHPYALVHGELSRHAAEDSNVFAEGLITPGVGTCAGFAKMFDRAVFILLDTHPHQCIRHVMRRRDAAGNTKPFDPANLFKKLSSARGWANRLEAAGLEVHRLQYPEAHRLCLELLGLQPAEL